MSEDHLARPAQQVPARQSRNMCRRYHDEVCGAQYRSGSGVCQVSLADLVTICPRIGTAAPELVKLCGYLPLALQVSACLLKSRPSRPVAQYLKQLGGERTRLEHLRDPRDPEMDVAASLRLSYDALEEAAKLALCQLSIFPTSFDLDAASPYWKRL